MPFDDPTTYQMISSSKTLGVFQIESPGQRELVGKSGIDDFEDIIADISLFRPGPVKSDMITPYLEAKQGWKMPLFLHDDLRPILAGTHGVVVFHEQVIEIIQQFTGCTFAEADEWRRALGDVEGMADTRLWFHPRALARGYDRPLVERVWKVIEAFASFGFCKAHAAAFALPTYQSAWLKAHYPAHFLSGVLTHDPGMYPKRLILDDARQLGITILGLDVNLSEARYVAERVDPPTRGERDAGCRDAAVVAGAGAGRAAAVDRGRLGHPAVAGRRQGDHRGRGGPDRGRAGGRAVRLADRLLAPGPGVPAGGGAAGAGRGVRHGLRHRRHRRPAPARPGHPARPAAPGGRPRPARPGAGAGRARAGLAPRPASGRRHVGADPDRGPGDGGTLARGDLSVRERAAAQSRAPQPARPVTSVQLALDLGDGPAEGESSGLPEMTASDRVRAELDILGLDASSHVLDFHQRFLDQLGVVRSTGLLAQRSRSQILVAGVKVATQTPPIRSGRRVIFLTLDDATGPVDATFFEDVQGPYAATVFGSWLLVVRGVVRRTGRRGISLRATGAWDLGTARRPVEHRRRRRGAGRDRPGAGGSRVDPGPRPSGCWCTAAASGCRRTPTSSRPARRPGQVTGDVARKLWHRSPGSTG